MATIDPTASGLSAHSHGEHAGTHQVGFIRKYIFSTDHKIIGIQFLITTLLMMMVGSLGSAGVRYQLAWPGQRLPIIGDWLFPAEGGKISPEFYTMLFTMHATVMTFLVVIPILAGAFGNFLIPLMIGADDMAFPKLNMFSYWFMWPAIICFGMSMAEPNAGPAAGWTVYPLLSQSGKSPDRKLPRHGGYWGLPASVFHP
ncbi:MAG: cbb3-type cytochrome c oxidase subunit I [Planctomycetaceae bacterium]